MSTGHPRRRRRALLAACASLLTGLGIVVGTGADLPAVAAGSETLALPTGTITVEVRGNGHGHGMSQYGARGAAIAGLSGAQIVGFYYPGAALVQLPPSTIRVQLSGPGSGPTVVAPSPGLQLTGVGSLPTNGISQYRLIAGSGSTLTLQHLVGSTWSTDRTGLASGAQFSRPAGNVRVYLPDGSSTVYHGAVGAITSGGGLITINQVALDDYVAGVVPREMPASWQLAAVQAQAIAARSYGRNAVENSSGRPWDICDTTQCQVYGGQTRYDQAGNVLWTDDPAAVSAYPNTVLQYQGRTIFAQFSASDGGWTTSGGQPYLPAQADNYDNTASGDPYLDWTTTTSGAAIAGYFGLAKATTLEITGRDGNGAWGGRVTAGYVDGVDAQGRSQRIAATGFDLQAAMGLPTTWLRLSVPATPIGHIDAVQPVALHTYRVAGWSLDPNHTDLPTRVHIYVDNVGYSIGADKPRPDVQQAFGTANANHGFDTTVTVPGGTHTICVFGIDIDNPSTNTLFGCPKVTVPVDAMGVVDSVTKTAAHTYTVSGWAFDPDANGGSTAVDVWIDGRTGQRYWARNSRPDVQQVFGLANDQEGFVIPVTVPAGQHSFCVFAINTVGAGQNTLLTCRNVSG